MTRIFNRDLMFKGNVGVKFRRQTVTGASNAASIRGRRVQITTESLTTAAGATFTETLTNAEIAADSMVLVTVKTSGTGTPVVSKITPAAGSVVIIIQNIHASAAFNAALVIDVLVIPNSTP